MAIFPKTIIPLTIPHILQWLDGTDINNDGGITNPVNNTAIATWKDRSGRGANATQATGANQPLFKTNQFGLLPAVSFDGINDQLAMTRMIADNFTIIAVFKSSQGIGTGTNWYDGAGLVDSEVSGVVADFGTGLNANGVVMGGTGNPDRTATSGAAAYNNNIPHTMVFTRLRSSGALTMYVDDMVNSKGTNTGGTQGLTSPARIVIGSIQTNVRYYAGLIGEIIIYGKVLDSAERLLIGRYLANKWGSPV